ncbi:glycosyltransferase [Azospirillum argentinense]|uniref:Glycosyltransferase n=1 Tax=Azospirillum argentinense TaxID=2970906 RepID=A0ABW8VJ59_9PROT
MSSLLDTDLPRITFVGRPLDPQKGLATLLDALERLLSLTRPPRFSVWIVGGDADEVPHVRRLIRGYPHLRRELVDGRITVWGKFSREALPEIYRRSHAVVMPSLREQFGLVAIEAMACGCPVIGTRQGGIGDTVRAGLTGATVEVDQPDALAAALLLYLRNHALRDARGMLARHWTAGAFAKADAYGRIARLYTDPLPPELGEPDWDRRARFSEARVVAVLPVVEAAIGGVIERWQVVADRYHVIARLETTCGPMALKAFRDRPSLAAAMLPVGRAFAKRTAADFVDNALFHNGNPVVPPLVATDRSAGFAVYSWLDGTAHDEPYGQIRGIAEGMEAHASAAAPNLDTTGYHTALEQFFRAPDEAALAALDDRAAAVNRVAQRIGFGLRAIHPTVELHRILMSAELASWPLPADVIDRIRMAVLLLLSQPSPTELPLRLCHGDLKARHIAHTGGHMIVLDTEHSVFAAGELDLGALGADELVRGVNAFTVVRRIRSVATDGGAATALQWALSLVVYAYLARAHHGSVTEPTRRLRRILSDLCLALE